MFPVNADVEPADGGDRSDISARSQTKRNHAEIWKPEGWVLFFSQLINKNLMALCPGGPKLLPKQVEFSFLLQLNPGRVGVKFASKYLSSISIFVKQITVLGIKGGYGPTSVIQSTVHGCEFK